jgi:hypothetical protein
MLSVRSPFGGCRRCSARMHFAEAVKMALYYTHRTPRPMPAITVSSGTFEHRDPVLVEQIGERLARRQLARLAVGPRHVAPVPALLADEHPLAPALAPPRCRQARRHRAGTRTRTGRPPAARSRRRTTPAGARSARTLSMTTSFRFSGPPGRRRADRRAARAGARCSSEAGAPAAVARALASSTRARAPRSSMGSTPRRRKIGST